MTNPNLTEIICIIDRSGSMDTLVEDAIGGFNTFLKEQQKLDVDKCNLTYIQFDDKYELVHECKPVREVPLLTRDTYQPRGLTALLDAVGRTIDDTGKRYAALPEHQRPGAVIFVILTDGLENVSQKYRASQIKEMVEHQTDRYGWQFVYLGANQDSFAEAGAIGFKSKNIGNFKATGKGIKAAYLNVSHSLGQYRSSKCDSDLIIQDESS